MKKQFTKFKIAAENLSRSSKSDKDKDAELETIEKQVERYREVLEKMVRKMPTVSSTTDAQERDKRIRKNSHYKIGVALDDSSKDLAKELPLHHVLGNCGELEKSIAECIVDSELETETEVVRRLKQLLENEIQDIATHKRNVTRTLQEYASLKRNYETAIRLEEQEAKIANIKEQQEQCEIKLEKERDLWAAKMFELIAKEDIIVNCLRDYVLNQRNYHERALHKVNASLAHIQDIIQSTAKSRFGASLAEHLSSTDRQISYIIELCVCCLIEHGLQEEGLLRVGCAKTKLARMKRALEAQHVKTPLPVEYQDPHVIGSILKLYMRELPEPLLTYKYYKDFIRATERNTEAERKSEIKAILNKLPAANLTNIRYLTKFLWLVTQNAELNRMNSHNLAIVMSPNMIWPRPDKANTNDYMGQVNCSSAGNIIVELLISQWEYFFEGDVEFFQTLQRNKLFVVRTKSNSSNEHLDKHEGDSLDSPRFGTIRRPKAFAPSPPQNNLNNNNNNNGIHNNNNNNINNNLATQQQQNKSHRNSVEVLMNHQQRGKELFPSDKPPEKPPLPKVTQLALPPPAVIAIGVTTISSQTNSSAQQQQQQQQSQQNQDQQQIPKPVPMTRTQFFGLDNLPSPVADRKSNDSVNSLTFKPDLPKKPKIPNRPMVLGLVNHSPTGGSKSDDEATPAQQHKRKGSDASDGCDHTTTSTSTSIKEQHMKFVFAEQSSANEQQHLAANDKENINAVPPSQPMPIQTNSNTSVNDVCTSGDNTKMSESNQHTVDRNDISTTTTTSHDGRTEMKQTPTTPLSPNMILTPKRPTVPAPPPPSNSKK